MLRLQEPEELVWGCVQTVGGREALCASEIVRAGLSCFWPRFAIEQRCNGTAKRTRRVMHSLFPGYVFAGWPKRTPDTWRLIRSLPGQRRVIEYAYDVPARVDPAFLRSLIGHEGELAHNLIAARVALGLEVKPGSQVKVVEGPFAGLHARLLSLDGDGRIAVLLDILGGQTVVKGLRTDQVAAV